MQAAHCHPASLWMVEGDSPFVLFFLVVRKSSTFDHMAQGLQQQSSEVSAGQTDPRSR